MKPSSERPCDVLITCLGRAPKAQGCYRTTRYRFEGRELPALAFVGWLLGKELAVDRLLVLGTAGSMWDHLFEIDVDLVTAHEAMTASTAEGDVSGRAESRISKSRHRALALLVRLA